MTAPATTDQVVEFVQGSAEDVVIPLLDADGNPVDLAGWTAHCQVRYAPTAASPVLAEWQSGTSHDIVLANSAARLVVDAAMAAESLAWTWRLGVFDLLMVAPAGLGLRPNRPQRGLMRLIPATTR